MIFSVKAAVLGLILAFFSAQAPAQVLAACTALDQGNQIHWGNVSLEVQAELDELKPNDFIGYFRIMFTKAFLPSLLEDEQAFAKRMVEKTHFVSGEIADGSIGSNASITIMAPDEFKNSLIVGLMLWHEIVHGLDLYRAVKKGRGEEFIRETSLEAKGLFWAEKRAMSGEWHFLHFVPAKMRQQVALFLRVHSAGHIFLPMFTDSILGLDEYLEANWKRGRYDMAECGRKVTLRKEKAGEPFTDVFQLSDASGLLNFCESTLRNSR